VLLGGRSRSTLFLERPEALLPFEGPMAHFLHEVRGFHARDLRAFAHERGIVEVERGEYAVHAPRTRKRRTNARVSDAFRIPVSRCFQVRVEVGGCGSCWDARQFADHEAFDLHGVRFLVLGRGAVVPDERIGHCSQSGRCSWVGEHFW